MSVPEFYDIRDIVKIVWSSKWLVASITALGSVVFIALALILPDQYRSDVLLAPNGGDRQGGLAGLASQFGGIAGLASLDLGANSDEKTKIGLEVLKSREFISDFIDRHDVLVPLIAAERWDRDTNTLVIDSDKYDIQTGEWVRKVRLPKQTIPSRQEAYKEFMKNVFSISRDKSTGFVTISVTHYSPHLAQQWAEWLVTDINQTVMRRDVTEASQAIAFLNRQIAETSLTDLQAIFFRLIEEQTKTMMLAEVSDEYLLKTLDPAIIPEKRWSPNRPLICVLGALLSILLGIVVVLARDARRSKE